jgi:hypothetical protein
MRVRDLGWLAFAGLWSVFGVLAALGMLVAVAGLDWLRALEAPLYALGAYWFAAGAWLRTERGRQGLGTPPPAPPTITTARARGYIALAAVCVLACAIALGGQWLATR